MWRPLPLENYYAKAILNILEKGLQEKTFFFFFDKLPSLRMRELLNLQNNGGQKRFVPTKNVWTLESVVGKYLFKFGDKLKKWHFL